MTGQLCRPAIATPVPPTRLAIVAPLLPTRSSVATYVAHQLPALARRVEVVLATPDPGAVAPALAADQPIVALDEIGTTGADAVLYHLGNGRDGFEVLRAIEHGPPGIVVVHDVSIHHLICDATLGRGDPAAYVAAVEAAFGERGRRLAELRAGGERGQIELVLFDLLGPALSRHRAVIVHSQWAAGLIARRAPGLPVSVLPHVAPQSAPPLSRSALAVPAEVALVGLLGDIGPGPRAELLLGALRLLFDRGRSVHVVVGGGDLSGGELSRIVEQMGLGEHVTITGELPDRQIQALAATLDVVVALPTSPGSESSWSMLSAASAGTPLVAWPIGPVAELPPESFVAAPVGGDEVSGLADVVGEVLANPARSAALGARAQRWALDECSVDRSVERLLAAIAAAPTDPTPVAAIDRPWGSLVGRRGGGRAVVAGGDGDHEALQRAGWMVRPVAGVRGVGDAPVGWADLVVWKVSTDEHVDRSALEGLHRVVAPTGRLIVRGSTPSVLGVVAKALEAAGFGAGGLARPEPSLLGEEYVLPLVKTGPGR